MPVGFGFYDEDAPVLKENASLRKENISRILFTGQNERVNNPSFGSSLLKYLFNFENSIREDIEDEIRRRIKKHQPDLDIKDMEIKKDNNKLIISISLTDTMNKEEIDYDTVVEVE